MEKIGEQFPKAMADVLSNLPENLHLAFVKISGQATSDDMFNLLFGWLVLIYFPKYKIEIERVYTGHYRVMWREEAAGWHGIDDLYDDPKDAVEKAFEIREKQLKKEN